MLGQPSCLQIKSMHPVTRANFVQLQKQAGCPAGSTLGPVDGAVAERVDGGRAVSGSCPCWSRGRQTRSAPARRPAPAAPPAQEHALACGRRVRHWDINTHPHQQDDIRPNSSILTLHNTMSAGQAACAMTDTLKGTSHHAESCMCLGLSRARLQRDLHRVHAQLALQPLLSRPGTPAAATPGTARSTSSAPPPPAHCPPPLTTRPPGQRPCRSMALPPSTAYVHKQALQPLAVLFRGPHAGRCIRAQCRDISCSYAAPKVQ